MADSSNCQFNVHTMLIGFQYRFNGFVAVLYLISGHNMASAQIRHFYNTPTTISSTTTRQPLQQQQHTNNCNCISRKQFQNDTFLCHTQTQSESEAAAATLCQSTLAAAATSATGTTATAAATDDVPASECPQSWTTDENSDSDRDTQHRMRNPLDDIAAGCDVAVLPVVQQQQDLADSAAPLVASTGISEQDRLATSTCLSRLSSKVSQDSTKQQRKLYQHGEATKDYAAAASTTPAVGILTDMQKFARSIFPLVIIFNLLPLFYAGEYFLYTRFVAKYLTST